jgi:citrate synthase
MKLVNLDTENQPIEAQSMTRYLTSKQVTERLGISAATLYSYVSRGLLRSEAGAEDSRERRYLAEDVEKLIRRKAQRGSPAKGARAALQWGSPVLESALTLIDDERLYYRGHDAVRLARERTFEETAALLWTGDMGDAARLFGQAPEMTASPLTSPLRAERGAGGEASFPTRVQIALALAGDSDLRAFDKAALPLTGARILDLLCAALSAADAGSLAERLAAGWQIDGRAARLLNAALILCADHELNASSFAARVVASTGATLYHVVSAGFAALQGVKHGGNTRLVLAFIREVEAAGDPLLVIRDRLQRGERIPGFGHHLYHADPRAAALFELLRADHADQPAFALAEQISAAAAAIIDRAPNIDFALVTLARTLHLPDDAPLALFALGRAAGWIAHAIEQYADDQLIRPRAVYTGASPVTDG